MAEVAFVGSPDAAGRVLGLVDALVTELGALSLDGAGRGVLRALVAALGRVRAGADAAEARAVTALEGLGDGGVDAVEVLRRNTGSSHREARRRRQRAGTLAKMPKVSEALAKGDISPEHADALARAAEATSAGAVDDDAALLAEVAAVPADRAGREIQSWTQRNQDPVDLHEQHLRQRRRRRLHFGEGDDGMLTAHAAFDRVLGAQFRSLIGGIADRLWRAEGGRDNPNSRSVEQRRLDALAIAVGLQPAPPADAPQHSEPTHDSGTPNIGEMRNGSATEGRRQPNRGNGVQSGGTADSSKPDGRGRNNGHNGVHGGSRTPASATPNGSDPDGRGRNNGHNGHDGVHGGSRTPASVTPDGGGTEGRGRNNGGNGVHGDSRTPASATPNSSDPDGRGRIDVHGDSRTPASATPDGSEPDGRRRTGERNGVQGGGGTRSGTGARRSRGADSRARAKDPTGAQTVPPRHQIVIVASADVVSGKDPQGRCEIPGIGPIPQTELERLACDAELFGLLFSGDGEPLWHGRGERTATDAQRRALLARDGGCVLCAAEPAWCESHHLKPWAPPGDGPTDIDNLALLCTKCHHRLHDHKRVLIRHPQRGWDTAPDPRHDNGHRRRDKPDRPHDKPGRRQGKSNPPRSDRRRAGAVARHPGLPAGEPRPP